MTLDQALRLTEILMALAFIQQSLEHMAGPVRERFLFAPRFLLCLVLLAGVQTPWVCLALVVLTLFILHRFQGPYNGGSDRMSILLLCCVTAVHFIPDERWKEYVFAYLAFQLVLSYFISGYVKLVNPDWRNGQALRDVFLFSAYPVSESLRGWAAYPKTVFAASWIVILFEILFPLSLLTQVSLVGALVLAALFHFSNACFFGLNRFFWIWLAAYPSILWFQERIFGVGIGLGGG